MLVAETPGPEDGSRAEHQRAAFGAIERQVVRSHTRCGRHALIEQDATPRKSGFGELDQTSRTGFVAGRDIPLITDNAGCDACRGDIGIAPDPQVGECRGNLKGAAKFPCAIRREQLASQHRLDTGTL